MYWGTHIFKATKSRAETLGRGSRNWLKITLAWGSSDKTTTTTTTTTKSPPYNSYPHPSIPKYCIGNVFTK